MEKDLSQIVLAQVISQTQHDKNMKIDIWADTMCWIMPDRWFTEYRKALDSSCDEKYGRDRRRAERECADRFFKKHAYSQI
jgi:hypothetical protein